MVQLEDLFVPAGLGHLWPNALCHQLSGIPDRRLANTIGVA